MKDFILGFVLLVLSILVLLLSSSFPNFVVRGERLPGPKFFPTILAIVLICFAAYCILLGFMRFIKRPKGLPEDKEELEKTYIVNVMTVILSVILFVPIINFFGTVVGIVILGAAVMTLLGIKWQQSLIYSSLLAFLVYMIFQVFFRVPLVEGTLFSFLVR